MLHLCGFWGILIILRLRKLYLKGIHYLNRTTHDNSLLIDHV